MRRLGRFALVAFAASVLAVATAAATRSAAEPYTVLSASLTQQGQQLVWNVQLDHPFSPSSLRRSGRSLCLLLDRKRRGLEAVVCLEPGHHPGQPALFYIHVTPHAAGSEVQIPATISRPAANALTASFTPIAVGLSYRSIRWQVTSTLTSPACGRASQRCQTMFPSEPVLARLHTPKLIGCAARGPSLVYAGSPDAREVALTFDDGPWFEPPSSEFLRALVRAHAVATFFEIGEHIDSYDPGGVVERRMLAEGDMIGDHSWSHPDVAALSRVKQRAQLLDTIHAIRKATGGFTPCLWRPPYGDISPALVALARSLGLLTVMWDVDPRDWSLPGVDAIYENVVTHAHDGAIVIQHYGGGPRYQTLAALPREIKTLRSRGYRLVTVAQLLGLRLIYK